jgi:putative polyketide hydroxylase
MSHVVEEFEVAIVGAGPGGLTAAATLGSYGVPALVVDRRLSTSRLPRATVASTGTMELLRRFGLEQAARERSIDVEWQAWACTTLAAAHDGEAVEVGLPTRAQAAVMSPTTPACVPQDELEPLLEEHLASLPHLRLERGVELIGLEQESEGTHLLTLAGPGRRRRRIRARYLIGADGPRSTIREAFAIETASSGNLGERLVVVFRAPLWELAGHHRHLIYFLTGNPEDRSLIPAGKPDRWVLGMPWDGAEGDVEEIPPAQLKRWIGDAAGAANLPIEIERWMRVVFGVALAERFRVGTAFLIGDAAHRVTPRGGTGLNTAIRDGYDLAWRLAWVVHGWADEQLLDGYERERRPVAEFNTQRSSRADGSLLGTQAGLTADIGGRIAHAWVPRGDGLVSTLDLLSRGLTLFTGPHWGGSLPTRGAALPPVNVERLDAITARALGLTTAGWLLARPDGHPIALSNSDQRLPDRPEQHAYHRKLQNGSRPDRRVAMTLMPQPHH